MRRTTHTRPHSRRTACGLAPAPWPPPQRLVARHFPVPDRVPFVAHRAESRDQRGLAPAAITVRSTNVVDCSGMPVSSPAPRHRWWLLPAGMLLGVAASTLGPGTTGCLYHDTCIKVTSPGTDYCRNLANAMQWPVDGSIDDAVPILRPDGSAPRGCRCYNDAELEIFKAQAPQCRFDEFMEDLALATRQECQSLVMPGYDHNCWTTTGPEATNVEGAFAQPGPGACVGNCEYGAPPAGGSCPTPNPYECATGDGGDEACDSGDDTETSTGGSGLDDTTGDTSGGVLPNVDTFVSCEERDCEIDEAFARALHADPSPLFHQPTRLVYHTELRRHIFEGVEPGTLAFALGLRTGDRLESVDGVVIYDLDSAVRAYVRLGDASALHVRVKRGAQWLDFTYTFVP
jgi:hypothetical protein